MFGLFKPKSQGRPSFEEQLRVLTECGIALSPSVTPEALLISHKREVFEGNPFKLLLCCMGGEAEDPSQAGPTGYPSDQIWHFDTECIEGDGSYVRIARRMSTLAQGALPLEDIEDCVDPDEGEKASLSFKLDGQTHQWEPELNDDWVDAKILSKFAALLVTRKTDRRYTYINLGGQDCLIGCSTPAQRKMLEAKTPLRVEWLK